MEDKDYKYRCNLYSIQYHLLLDKGDKVVLEMGTHLEIVQVCDEKPPHNCEGLIWACTHKRMVRFASGSIEPRYTCDMRYCPSLKNLPLGLVEKMPLNFAPWLPEGAQYLDYKPKGNEPKIVKVEEGIYEPKLTVENNEQFITVPNIDYGVLITRSGNRFYDWYQKEYPDYKPPARMNIINCVIQPFLFISEFGAELSETTTIQRALERGCIDGMLSEYGISNKTYCGRQLREKLEKVQQYQEEKLRETEGVRVRKIGCYINYEINANNVKILNPSVFADKSLLVDIDVEEFEEVKELLFKKREAQKELQRATERLNDARRQYAYREYGAEYVCQSYSINELLEQIIKDTNGPRQVEKERKRLEDIERERAEEAGEVRPLLKKETVKLKAAKQVANLPTVSESIEYDGAHPVLTAIQDMTVNGNTLGLPQSTQWDKSLYTKVKKFFSDSDFQYVKNCFVHPSDAIGALQTMYDLDGVNPKVKFQFYRTTPTVVRMATDAIESIEKIERALEPSGGDGALIEGLRDMGYTGAIDTYEAWDANRAKLERMEGVTVKGDDFMKATGRYQLIIANPPFTNNTDIKHINKMYEMLEEGGQLVTVASAYWKESGDKICASFRDFLKRVGAKVTDIPRGEFAESGTTVPTTLIVLRKAAVGAEQVETTVPIKSKAAKAVIINPMQPSLF